MLLHDPHHDGSPMYVADEAPAHGSEAPVRLGTSTTGPVVLGVEPLA
jgi:alpha-glucosidase